MANKSILVAFLIAFLGISLIVIIPFFTLSIQLSTYDVLEETDDSFVYAPTNSSPVEKLNIYAERGDIEIRYISPLVNYFAMIEVNIKMSGNNLAGKSYTDFFNIEWDSTSPSPSFIMEFKSNVDKITVLPLIKNLTILVNLRSGIIFDLNITLEEGDVDLLVPFRVPINNVVVDITKGNIFYDFKHCTIGGNITGRVNDGNIDLKTFNSRYTRNNNWNFTIETGDINLNMTHNKDSIDLGANITSITTLNDGSALFIYEDNSANIGARFEIPFGNQTPRTFFPDCLRGPLQNCFLDGFHYNEPVLPEPGFPAEGDIIFTSFDLFNKQVMNYYDFLFIIDEGDFYMILTSIN